MGEAVVKRTIISIYFNLNKIKNEIKKIVVFEALF
jgi:hypothetical protein